MFAIIGKFTMENFSRNFVINYTCGWTLTKNGVEKKITKTKKNSFGSRL